MRVVPPARAGGRERLVVEYRDAGAAEPRSFYVTVPLGDDGRPAHPFGYAGGRRDAKSIAAELPAEQVRAVEGAELPAFVGKTGGGQKLDASDVESRSLGPVVPRSKVWAIVFGRAAALAPAPPAYTADRAEMNARREAFLEARLRLGPGEQVVLVPRQQPRPRGQAVSAAARALLATPVTLGMDAMEVALAPLALVVWRE